MHNESRSSIESFYIKSIRVESASIVIGLATFLIIHHFLWYLLYLEQIAFNVQTRFIRSKTLLFSESEEKHYD